jgi:hypothetical protein
MCACVVVPRTTERLSRKDATNGQFASKDKGPVTQFTLTAKKNHCKLTYLHACTLCIIFAEGRAVCCYNTLTDAWNDLLKRTHEVVIVHRTCRVSSS